MNCAGHLTKWTIFNLADEKNRETTMKRDEERERPWGQSEGRCEKIALMVVYSLLFIFIGSGVHAETLPTKDKEPIIEHLEFLGYECDRVEVGIRAKHLSKIHLYITYAFGGIRMQTGFPGKPPYSDIGSRFKVTNALGKQLSVMQVYWSEGGNLFAMAWMPGRYEKSRYALFMEAWDHDAVLLRQSYDLLKPFLKEQANGPGQGESSSKGESE